MNKYNKQIKEHELVRILVDLDDTLAKQIWPQKGIGEPIKDMVDFARYADKLGYKIWIHTTRPSYDVINAENWAKDNDVPIRGVETGKPLGLFYVDDRAVNPYCKECMKRMKSDMKKRIG